MIPIILNFQVEPSIKYFSESMINLKIQLKWNNKYFTVKL